MLGQSTYDAVQLEVAIDRLARELPRSSRWPTQFASDMLDRVFAAADVVTDGALLLLGQTSSGASGAVAAIHAAVTTASGKLVPDARAIGIALGARDPYVQLPGYRDRLLDLLGSALRGWGSIVFLDSIRPWFLRLRPSTKAYVTAMRQVAARLLQTGGDLRNLAIPAFPDPDPPRPPPARPASSARAWLVAALATAAAGTAGVVFWRRRR